MIQPLIAQGTPHDDDSGKVGCGNDPTERGDAARRSRGRLVPRSFVGHPQRRTLECVPGDGMEWHDRSGRSVSITWNVRLGNERPREGVTHHRWGVPVVVVSGTKRNEVHRDKKDVGRVSDFS